MDNLSEIISNWHPLAQYIIGFLIAVGALWALWDKTLGRILRWGIFKLWPSREEWGADCPKDNANHLDPNIAWRGSPNDRRCQMREMRKGDFYSLYIQKPRVISCIEARTEGMRYPIKYLLEIKETNDSAWISKGIYDGPIKVDLDKPTKLIQVRFTITEPMLAPEGGMKSWCIYDILLTEVLFFHRWGRRVIR